MNCETVLRLLLNGSELIGFDYWAGFQLRFQRSETNPEEEAAFRGSTVPEFFSLRLHGPWWVGDVAAWRRQMAEFPIQPAEGLPPDAPLQAATLVHLLGATILSTELQEPGSLVLRWSNGETLHIAGTGTEEDESWLLETVPEEAGQEPWYVVCDKNGDLFGRWPEAE